MTSKGLSKKELLQNADKYEAIMNTIMDYLLTDIHISDGEVIKFNVVDYFCLTDCKPAEVLAYIRAYRQDMNANDRRIIGKFLGANQELGEQLTDQILSRESITYIVNGQQVKVTNEMWEEIRTTFNENNIPDLRFVMSAAARRLAHGQPILPLIDIAKKENKTIQYIKK